MSIIRHEVHEDFLKVEEGLDSPSLRQVLEQVKGTLSKNPFPGELGCERRKENRFRVWLRGSEEELELLYDVELHDIYLISLKRRWHKRAIDTLNALLTFAPK